MNSAPRIAKVLFVSTMDGYPWGGSEELWSRTAMRLRHMEQAVAASVYQWPSCPTPVAELRGAGAKVAFRPLHRSMTGRLIERCIQRLKPSPIDSRSLSWLKMASPDLVVISQGGPWDGVPWMTACRELGLRYCPIIQANSEIWWATDERLDGIRSAFSSAVRVFFVSHANQRLMEMQCGMRLEHAEVVLNPWKVDATSEVPWPAENGITRIACVGRVDPQAKGQDLLMEVLAMPKWRQRALHLTFYGHGPCVRALEALQQMLELRNVIFAGHVSDVRTIWAENHALILPSRFEGLPLVIVEAMLCGRPVITTDVAGNAEYLRDGITGFVAEAPTCRLVDAALERAWSKRSEWEKMGAKARQDAVELLPADPVGRFAERLMFLAR
ncbi:MAG: glycosyltransferase family 4 protein [Verrucomicrobiota bacterium]